MATKTEAYLGKADYTVVGTRPIRHDGEDKVTGRAIYGADVNMSGLLSGKVLRSPHAHARIKSIDTSKAKSYPGVKAVITVDDFEMPEDKVRELGEGAANLRHLRANVLADGKALYHGHAVAAVAAVDANTAEEALDLIEVDYDVLEPVLDVRRAMEDDAPLLHENQVTESLGESTDKKSNVSTHFQHKLGDLEKGFSAADVVIEREFDTATVHQGYIEPHNGTAHWKSDGHVTVWCSTQGSFPVREQVSQLLMLPVSKVKVIPTEIGVVSGARFVFILSRLPRCSRRKQDSRSRW